MSNEAESLTPSIPFSLMELQAIEQVLWGYSQYLLKSPASGRNSERYQSLQTILQRLAKQLKGDSGEVQVFLSVDELEELVATLREFARLLVRLFPRTEEREVVRETVNIWLLRIAGIIAEFDV